MFCSISAFVVSRNSFSFTIYKYVEFFLLFFFMTFTNLSLVIFVAIFLLVMQLGSYDGRKRPHFSPDWLIVSPNG